MPTLLEEIERARKEKEAGIVSKVPVKRKNNRLFLPDGSLKKIVECFELPFTGNKIKCPFHDDHEPSLLINDNNTFKCFGCNKSGNAWTFTKDFLKTDNDDIVRSQIEGFLGITIEQSKEKEEMPQHKNCVITKDRIYQTIKSKVGFKFCYLEKTKKAGANDELKLCDDVICDGITYKPQFGEEVNKSMVLLPTEPLVLPPIKELLAMIQGFIHKYCDVDVDFETVCSYYVLMTWVYDRLAQLNYLSFLGDTGTGKTRSKLAIGTLCYTPILVNGGSSAAAVYRLLDKWGGTLLMDEADMKASDESQDMIKLLNCGMEINNPIAKCDKNDPNKIDFFNPYSPKIISRRFPFEDKALESRCLTFITQETRRDDVPITLSRQFYDEAQVLRNYLLTFRLVYYFDINDTQEDIFGKGFCVEPRIKQVNTSLAIVLRLFPELFEGFKVFLMKKQQELIQERSDSKEGLLVQAYCNFVSDGKKLITAKDLSDKMNEFAENEVGDRYCFTARGLSKTLKALGFHSKRRREGCVVGRFLGVDEQKLRVLRSRYFVTNSCDDVTVVTVCTNTAKNSNNSSFDSKGSVFGDNVPVSHSTVTNVTNVTNLVELLPEIITQLKTIFGKVCFASIENYCKIDTSISTGKLEAAIQNAKSKGLIFEPKPDQFEVLK